MQRGIAGTAGLYLIAALLLVAAVEQQPLLVLVAFIILALMGLTMFWQRWCLTRMEYRRTLGQERAFVGETIDLWTEVTNRKLLPLPWLEVEDETPEELGVSGGKLINSSKPLRLMLRSILSLRWYERVSRRYQVECLKRGYHVFGPVVMRSGDIFGFFNDQTTFPVEDYLIIYPQIVPLQELGLPTKQPFGSRKAQLRILDDPMRVAGVREYTAGDSLKRVHWKASARTQRLQVKLQEPSADLDLLIFLNVTTFIPDWQGGIPELLEEAIVVAASLADYAFNQGYRVGLFANTSIKGSDQAVKLAPARDPGQMTRILETLAKVTGYSSTPMDVFLQRESVNLPWGATVVLVTAVTPDATLAALLRLKRSGHRVATVLVGEHAVPSELAGLNVLVAHRNVVQPPQEPSQIAVV